MKTYFGVGLTALLLFGVGGAFAQQHHPVTIDDTGQVIPAHQHMHVKAGHTVGWGRNGKSWYVRFANSPCAEGNEFSSDGVTVCHVTAVCKAAGPSCTYAYQSATGRGAQMNDPDLMVDP